MDIHVVLVSIAAAAGFAGMIVSFNAFSAVATWCMLMCLFHTGRQALELIVCLLAGFVYHTHMNTIGFGLYMASYAFFLAALPHRKLVVVPEPVDTSVEVRVDGDDI